MTDNSGDNLEVLVMPWPPSVNSLYMQGPKHGQKFLTKKGKEFKTLVHALYADSEREAIEGPLQVSLMFIPPDSRQRDLDNYIKATLDQLTYLNFIDDDSQIEVLAVSRAGKSDKLNKGAVLVTIGHVNQDEMVEVCAEAKRQIIQLIESLGDDYGSIFHKPTIKELKSRGKI